MLRLFWPLAAFLLPGCSNAERSLCEASLEESLLSPETLEMKDFEEIDAKVANQMLRQKLASDSGVGSDSTAMDLFFKELPANAKAFKARYTAQGKTGNSITNIDVCVVESGKCDCETVE